MNEESEAKEPAAKKLRIDNLTDSKIDDDVDFTEDVAETKHQGLSYQQSKYDDLVTPEEVEKLKEFRVLDEVKSNDENSDDNDDSDDESEGIPEDEIEKMLEENLPDQFKGVPKPKEKPFVTCHKIILEEKGINQFEVLPLDWLCVRHCSGMPIYLHRPSRVATLSRPYALGKGNTKRHEIPISAIPCLSYRRALEEEAKQNEIDKIIDEQIRTGSWKDHTENKQDSHTSKHYTELNKEINKISMINVENKIARENNMTKDSSLDNFNNKQNIDLSVKLNNDGCDDKLQSADNNEKSMIYDELINVQKSKNDVDSNAINKQYKINGDINSDATENSFNCLEISKSNVKLNGEDNKDMETDSNTYNNDEAKGKPSKCPYSLRLRQNTSQSFKPQQKTIKDEQNSDQNQEIESQLDTTQDNSIDTQNHMEDKNNDTKNNKSTISLHEHPNTSCQKPCSNSEYYTSSSCNKTNTSDENTNIPGENKITSGENKITAGENTNASGENTNILGENKTTSGENKITSDENTNTNCEIPTTSNENTDPSNLNPKVTARPIVLPGGIVMPPPRVENISTSWKTQHLTADQVNDYCKKLFKFKTVKVMHFVRWPERRKYARARKALQAPPLPRGTTLITLPNTPQSRGRRDWVMNTQGCSYLSVFHEYVQRALQHQPVYEFQQLENASTPYQATVYIGGMQYGVGRGASKRAAKSAAARASMQVLVPGLGDWDPARADLAFFEGVGVEDPRVGSLCAAACEPSPHAVLRTCLLRNLGAATLNMKMKKLEHQKIELTMTVGKHSATVVCKNKKTAKQRAAQAILQALHPHIKSWGSLLRLYGSRSGEGGGAARRKEARAVTSLQEHAKHNQPNLAVLSKLREEMRRLSQRDTQLAPLRTMMLDHLPTASSSELNNVDL